MNGIVDGRESIVKPLHFRLAHLNVPTAAKAMFRLQQGPVPCYLRVR